MERGRYETHLQRSGRIQLANVQANSTLGHCVTSIRTVGKHNDSEMLASLVSRDRNHRYLQPLSDRLRDIPQRHAFFLHRVIRRHARSRLLDGQTIQVRNIF